jgi:hypothetical protein
MRQRYWLPIVLLLLSVCLAELFTIFDSAVSLDYSRARNVSLTENCRLLATLAEPRLVGFTESAVVSLVGPDVIVKAEGSELWVDDLVFRTSGGKVTGVDLLESCR